MNQIDISKSFDYYYKKIDSSDGIDYLLAEMLHFNMESKCIVKLFPEWNDLVNFSRKNIIPNKEKFKSLARALNFKDNATEKLINISMYENATFGDLLIAIGFNPNFYSNILHFMAKSSLTKASLSEIITYSGGNATEIDIQIKIIQRILSDKYITIQRIVVLYNATKSLLYNLFINCINLFVKLGYDPMYITNVVNTNQIDINKLQKALFELVQLNTLEPNTQMFFETYYEMINKFYGIINFFDSFN